MSEIFRKNIDLPLDVKKSLEEKAVNFDPPLKLKNYIEYMLKKLSKGELIEIKRKNY